MTDPAGDDKYERLWGNVGSGAMGVGVRLFDLSTVNLGALLYRTPKRTGPTVDFEQGTFENGARGASRRSSP